MQLWLNIFLQKSDQENKTIIFICDGILIQLHSSPTNMSI